MNFGFHQTIGGILVDAGVHFQHCRMGQTVVDVFGGQFFASTVVDVIVDQSGVVAHARCVETSFLGTCLHTLVVVVVLVVGCWWWWWWWVVVFVVSVVQ